MNKFVNLDGTRIKLKSIKTYQPRNDKGIEVSLTSSSKSNVGIFIFNSTEERDATIQGLDILCNCASFTQYTMI